ncbi:mitotic-spindle organizing protein 2B-like [Branchiostoma floridae]|uniref:Mitotic-spindle organizing protein 2B-like n=1 Tax=Branchiostoma floridae TaxID=7739 RepID=A0A9J7LY52_BRAFL|nr:mitotic-spindle organizing protein 2B-like [Branchiostoma floridae]XP_035690887.1 mitotic-spindle organizing protein 2B-like [Branchiostoma floridae]XP_035690888.1 mitotic-spindle organizing protein 2B-like [Branchiostoma floridae]XP_035690889.1 mitotic-spindle organizing protein 2B-like [Branchiostoma floridae]
MTSPQMAKSQTYNFMVLSKNVLSGEEADLYELCNLAGITMDPHVFKIVLDLLRLNVAPMTILQVLKSMANSAIKSRSAGGDTEAAHSHTHKDTSNVSSSSDSSSRSLHRQPRTKTSHKLSYKGHKS